MAPPTKAALLIGAIDHARREWEGFGEFVARREYATGTRADFLARCRDGEFDGVVAVYRSNESTKYTGPFDQELVDALPESVKWICHNGAGYDNIAVEACTKRGISVSNTPIAVNDATADMAMWLMLGALRRISIPSHSVRIGEWRGDKFTLGHDPKNKTLGILGMGGIGSAVATRARAFGMKIQYHNRNPLPASEAGDAKYVSFEELLRSSDVLSLNLSLNASTRHIIGKAQFDMMKEGVVLVNTARGPLIDEAALVKALDSGRVWSAGLDVYEFEPEVSAGLLANQNVVLLPHIGTATVETQGQQRDMELLVLENLKMAVLDGKLKTAIPEQRR
ncbi:hypothetical protein K490DRAFT_65961 [Saccharata proteae CBS 121410]|uniref:Glyoxylate reductase n=1 Tax=Saccharata proteae CBS 121410 TaxID=1314787 RepID=A0A9P4HWX8_9PEZI|nr:hypothetical protein K490DRAFT_65961 [Saccharata proteae CBS 121410]